MLAVVELKKGSTFAPQSSRKRLSSLRNTEANFLKKDLEVKEKELPLPSAKTATFFKIELSF